MLTTHASQTASDRGLARPAAFHAVAVSSITAVTVVTTAAGAGSPS